MNFYSISRAAAALIITVVFAASCSKSRTQQQHSNVNLQDKELKELQMELKGRWELQRSTGGYCAVCEHEVVHHPYMILSADHVMFGNDSLGVTEDSPISWQPASYFGGGYVFTTNSGTSLVPKEIVNDTLVLEQYVADGVTFRYTRSR